MQRYITSWRAWVIGSAGALFLIMAASEYFDIPHLLLGGPSSPINFAELAVEASLIAGAAAFIWALISRFDRRLNATLGQLERLATMDDLTGIPNRRQCLHRLEHEVQRARRFERPISVAIMDLDGFKSINDRLGHLVGDMTLVDFTRVVARLIRGQDFFGRLGGDEFLVIFIEALPEEWCAAHTPTSIPGIPAVTLSAGVTAPQAEDSSMTDCLRRADEALYQAKTTGRNKVEVG
jgi:diguanylate cyclase (GGDEF)-like protein